MDKYYTAGELAKISGVSSRTIRFYDEKGILKPSSYSEGDYRLYDKDAVLVLQQILMLKYVGFSLEEIGEVIKQDRETSLKDILEKQNGGKLYSTVPSMISKEEVEELIGAFLHKNVKTELNVKKEEEQQYVEECLKQCFYNVDNRFFVNPLFINEAESVYEYLCDSDKELQKILEKRRADFLRFLRKRLVKEESIRMNVKGHMYICER